MSELRRYIDAGAIFAQDLGSKDSRFTYNGTGVENSPFGRARTFNGTSDYVTNTNVEKLKTSQGTFAYKMKTASSSTAYVGGISYTGDIDSFLSLGRVDSNGKLTFYYRGIGTNLVETNAVVNDDEWHTIVINSDGSTYKIYVDGVLQDLTINTGSNNGKWINDMTNAVDILSIGVLVRSDVSAYFDGSIKEVIIDDRAWTQQEVSNYHENKVFDYSKSIVSRWNMDSVSSIKDMGWKNLGNDGAVVGTPVLENSIFGESLKFDGIDDYVTIDDSSIFGQRNDYFTFSTWIKPSFLAGEVGRFMFKAFKNDDQDLMGGYYDVDSETIFVRIWNLPDYDQTMLSATGIKNNEWYHVSVVIDGDFKLYVDGILKDSDNTQDYFVPAETVGLTKPFTIGAYNYYTSASKYFRGIIDKPMIFDKALSAIEIKDLYNRTRRLEL